MTGISVCVICLFVNGIFMQSPDNKNWNTVELARGRLVRAKDSPANGKASAYNEKERSVKRASVRLYLRTEGAPCCDGQQSVAETTSGPDGSFKFEKVSPNAYWFLANIEGREYKLAISYATGNKRDTNCSEILYELRDNELQILRVIQVD
jgi:hypothetical protein